MTEVTYHKIRIRVHSYVSFRLGTLAPTAIFFFFLFDFSLEAEGI